MTLVYLGAGWLIGLAVAAQVSLGWSVWLGLSLLPIAAAILQRDRRPRWRLYLALAFLMLGAARFQAAHSALAPQSIATFNGRGRGTFVGVVTAEPDPRSDRTLLVVAVEQAQLEDGAQERVSGLVLVEAPRRPAYRYGDQIRFSGRLEAPPDEDDFSYRDHLARQGIHSRMTDPEIEKLAGRGGTPFKQRLLDLKAHAQRTIEALLPEPAASLVSGILLGNDQGIARPLLADFNATGTSHIIAISGFNIGIIVSLLLKWLGRLIPRRTAGLVTILAISGYTLFVGADAAVVRAAVMGCLLTSASLLGRKTYGPASLMATAIGMTLFKPTLIADVGFQLSFAATGGLMLYGERFRQLALKGLLQLARQQTARRVIGPLNDALLLTLAAQLTTVPLALYHFGKLSLVSLLTNLLILPAQPYLMILGALATATGMVFFPAGQLLGWLCYPFVWWTLQLVQLTARFPGAAQEVTISQASLFVLYLLLLGATFLVRRAGGLESVWPRLSRRPLQLLGLIGSGFALLVIINLVRHLPDGKLHVTFLDVGEGEATLIESPAGYRVLIDGGPDPAVLLAHLGRELAFWERSIDLVIATHPDTAHINGLPAVLERYRVGGLITNGQANGMKEWHTLLATAKDRDVPLIQVTRGQRIDLADGTTLEVLHPAGDLDDLSDNNAIVLRLCYGDASFLLTADAGKQVEEELLANGVALQSIILKAADGGDRKGSCQPFLEAVDPWVVVFFVSQDDWENHPYPRLLDRLETMERTILQTDQLGSIRFKSDGHQFWVEAERGTPQIRP